ncbi:anti-sigma-B factor antagonist [Actinorhabdospora filicis]|uniref:Anti-sigma factor antagonist n=1 Tax=Actinorhabdospora filicis TaxID=1785913 RepID=A0A9W6SQR8_9ACTN|nr:STAS domain-containing protein [Actinorhabdospora filicis]GLZ80457.1 anti-sigma-B factor antagonist [Actinorhabdospora filicis]
MELALSTRTDGDRSVVAARGEIDLYSAPGLREHLRNLVSDGVRRLTVDLNSVEFLDSTGLGVLVGTLKRLREVGGTLVILCDQERILKIFRLTGLDQVFDIQDSASPDGS